MSGKGEQASKATAPQRKPVREPLVNERERRPNVDQPGQALVGLQRVAGNRASAALLHGSSLVNHAPGRRDGTAEFEAQADAFADEVVQRSDGSSSVQSSTAPRSNGETESPRNERTETGDTIKPSLLAPLERVAGRNLGGVRVHTSARAAEKAGEKGAQAFAVGQDIYFGAGRYHPGSRQGRWLLAHEVAHTIQQASTGVRGPQLKPDPKGKKTPRSVVRVTFYVDLDSVVIELDDDTSITIPSTYNGRPGTGTFAVRREGDLFKIKGPSTGTPNKDGMVIAWVEPNAISFKDVKSYTLRILSGKPGDAGKEKPSGAGGAGGRPGASAEAAKKPEEAGGGKKEGAGGGGEKVGIARSEDTPEGKKTPPPPSLSPEEDERWRELYRKMTGAEITAEEDPRELIRLYQVLVDTVEDPHFSKTKGDPWVQWAKFLDKNRDKIDGILKGGDPPGKLTLAKLQEIIGEYQKFIVGEPLEKDEVKELTTLEDFDKEFQYDPNWQRMSKEDKKLLLEFAKATPEELEKKKIDFSKITTSIKVSMALKLSESWPEEIKEAAKESFSDPSFIITLILIMAVYVGLWLTPDPSAITKVAAGVLTVVLLAQFGWEDIYGFAVAWSELNDECAAAKTVPELKTAGDKFAKKVGQVGFDIMMMIVLWRVGKAAGPKVKSIGARRGVVRAEAAVRAAEAKPGSGTIPKATPETAKLLDSAKSKAKGTTATAVLDALAQLLPEGTRKALADFRTKLKSDMAAYKALESEAGKGTDLIRFLDDKAAAPEARAKAKADLLAAQAKLARAKLIEAETVKDPGLRKAVIKEQGGRLKAILKELGILDRADVKKMIAEGKLNELTGALAEALQRTQLAAEFPASKGYRLLSNLAVVRRVPGLRTIAEWVAREKAAGRDSNPKKLFEKDGALWESVGEIDTMVTEPGAKGTLKPKVIEEVKSGALDKPSDAAAQTAKAKAGLKEAAAGTGDVKVYERSGKNTLGKDLTSSLDLSAVDSVTTQTRGPAGKGFTEPLPYDAEVLSETAASLITDGLPPAEPHPAVAPTLPKKKEKEPAGPSTH